MFDLADQKVIWGDIALAWHPRFANNLSGASLILLAGTRLRKTDLHTLFALHVRACGEPAECPDRADAVFAVDRGLTPFDHDSSRPKTSEPRSCGALALRGRTGARLLKPLLRVGA